MKLSLVLKEAINNTDWELVAKVYTSITGEFIEIPKPLPPPIDPEVLDVDIDITTIDVSQKGSEPSILIQKKLPEKRGEPYPEPTIRRESNFIVSSKNESFVPQKSDKGTPCKTRQFKKKNPGDILVTDTGEFDNEKASKNKQLKAMYGNKTHKKRKLRDVEPPIEVECRVCHKKELVPPVLAFTYDSDPEQNAYRCNDCCKKR
jgi:hypothetical protein